MLGQITVQLVKAAGCTVVGMDPQPHRAALALACGAHDVATSDRSIPNLELAFDWPAKRSTADRGQWLPMPGLKYVPGLWPSS